MESKFHFENGRENCHLEALSDKRRAKNHVPKSKKLAAQKSSKTVCTKIKKLVVVLVLYSVKPKINGII